VSARETGFSLIEVLVTMAIAAAVLTATGSLLSLLVQRQGRAISDISDAREAMAFMRLVDNLLADAGAGAGAILLERDALIVSGSGVPRSLAAPAEVVARLARERSGPEASSITFTIDRFDGDVASATSRRTATVLSELERFDVSAQIDGRWASDPPLAGSITRIRFAWLRKGGRPRLHDVDVRRGAATACIRNPLATGCSMVLPGSGL
jgi:prepilin-type N-terminal cleavage/methylation domain-containing protein